MSDKELEEWRELGSELQCIYGRGIWSLFSRVGMSEKKIRDAHKICVQRGITKFPYLVGVLKNLK